jgi:hypothetical protein
MLQLSDTTVPIGHEEPEPELSPAPEEGSYLWHLLRLRNTAALNLMVYHSAYEIRERELWRPQYRDWKGVLPAGATLTQRKLLHAVVVDIQEQLDDIEFNITLY